MFDGLKMWLPRQLEHVLREQRDGGRAGEDPPAAQCSTSRRARVPGTRRTNATPLPVSSALAGQSRTCCRRNAIATSSTAHVSERDEDLRDREPEVEADLPDHLQRGDRRREVQPRVAELRQQDRIGRDRGS